MRSSREVQDFFRCMCVCNRRSGTWCRHSWCCLHNNNGDASALLFSQFFSCNFSLSVSLLQPYYVRVCEYIHICESRGHTFFGCTIVAELHKKLTIEPGREYSFYFLRFIRLFMRGLLLKWSRRVCLFA